MKNELLSKETIKPSAPTPPHLKIYPLSFIDRIYFGNYVPLIFFYPNKGHEYDNNDGPDPPSKIICDQISIVSMLKKSLSKVLSVYYPFAGRFIDQLSIECNDQGVSLLVTRINSNLSKILHNPNNEALLNHLFPEELPWNEMSSISASIVAIQINCFACGGIAISVCMCHKVGDASSLFNFFNDWATLNRKMSSEDGDIQLPFLEGGASVFPQGDLPVFPERVFGKGNAVCRRFVFEGSKIESLKAMVSSNKVQNPTRVEVVTTLIYKCAVSALKLTFKTSSFRTEVNLRKRMVPPLPDKTIGNIIWFSSVSRPFMDNRETQLHDLVTKMKQGLSEFYEVDAKKLGGKEKDLSFISECLSQATKVPVVCDSDDEKNEHTLFYYTSWCRFPSYEADFGWGRPIWVTTSGWRVRNSVILMDARDGKGIEALVSMEEKDMVMFSRDAELLQYASLNPTVEYNG